MGKYSARILVTATGAGIAQGIIKALRLANKDLGREYEIFTADVNPLAVGLYRGDKGFLVPPANSPEYIEFMVKFCTKEGIQIVIPGCDPELPVLAANKSQFEKEHILVIVSSPEAIIIGYDKWRTYNFLKEKGFNYPLSSLPNDLEEFLQKVDFPLLVKPRIGSGSVGLNVVKNKEELDFYVRNTEKPIIQECLSSSDKEYTMGVVLSKARTVLGSITMKRKLKKGATYIAIIDDFPEIRKAAEEIVQTAGLIGSINIQMRMTKKGPVAFEINPRFSGTTAARAFAGFNDVDTVIRHYFYNEEIEKMKYKKLVMIRYLNEIYITPEDFEYLRDNKNIEFRGCSSNLF